MALHSAVNSKHSLSRVGNYEIKKNFGQICSEVELSLQIPPLYIFFTILKSKSHKYTEWLRIFNDTNIKQSSGQVQKQNKDSYTVFTLEANGV
jgi:hypothetical protein